MHSTAATWTVLLPCTTADGRYEDRRKGLRDEGPERGTFAQTLFDAPRSWRLEMEPVAIRGSRLALTRDRFRDTDDADRPITVEILTVTEVGDDDLMHDTVIFDPDDIDAAFAELDARYARGRSGRVLAHMVACQGGLCRVQSTRVTSDDVGLGEHRPSARGVIRARRRGPVCPCGVGRRARRQHLHRGCASAEQPRCGRHLRGQRDFETGFRRRMARDHHSDVRRRR